MNAHILQNVFIFLAAASIMVPIASRFKLGSVLGYLTVGVLIGPYGFKLIGNAEQIMHFAEFGVTMMLFLIGLELEPKMLWRLRKLIVGLGGLQVVVTTGLLTLGGVLLGYGWKASLAVSMALALSSTALVLQILQEKNLLKTVEGEASLAVLLFQDIAVIPILIIIPLLAHYPSPSLEMQKASFINTLSPFMHALLVTGVIGAIIITGHYFSRYLFLMVARTNLPEVFTAFSLSLIVGITLLMDSLGVSPALGTFIAGVVLANSQYKRTVEADIQPFKGLLLGLFFISVGMGINFNLFSQHTVSLLSIVFLLIFCKALIIYLLGLSFSLTQLQLIGVALILAQGGEFAFVLFQYASESRVITEETKSFFTLIIALSMLITPFLMLFYHTIVRPKVLNRGHKEQDYDEINEDNKIILAGYGRFGQIIGRVLNGEKIPFTVLEKDAQQIELLRKFGFKSYFGDANRLDLLKSAGANNAQLLIVTVANADVSLQIVKLAKHAFPHLKIFARARNRRHAYELHKAGVDYFKRELFDSSLAMTKEALKFLGYGDDEIASKAHVFQEHDEATLFKSFEFFEKDADLIHFTRQNKGELEIILKNNEG